MTQKVSQDGRQFSSKEILMQAIFEALKVVPASVIKNLTASMDSRLLEVHKEKGGPVKK